MSEETLSPSSQGSSKGPKAFTTHMPLREALAITMIMSILMPCLYAMAPQRKDERVLLLFLGGFCLLPFVLALRYGVFQAKSYGGYLLWVMASVGGGTALALLLSRLLFPGGAMATAFPIGIGAELLFVAADAGALRRNLIRRRKARQEEDISWTTQSTLLEEPKLFFFVLFVLAYLWGLSLDCPVLCDICLALAILYLPLSLSDGYLRSLGKYLSDMSSISNIPTKRIHLVGKAIVSLLLVLLLCLSLPSFLARGLRPYQDLRELKIEYRPPQEDDPSLMMDMAGTDLALFQELAGQGEYRETPMILKALFAVISWAMFLFLALLLLRAVRERFAEFRQTYDEGDLIIPLTEEAVSPLPLPRRRREKAGTAIARVRRLYKKTIQKALKADPPHPYEMPTDLEKRAGLADTPEGRYLHEAYEKARYDKGN